MDRRIMMTIYHNVSIYFDVPATSIGTELIIQPIRAAISTQFNTRDVPKLEETLKDQRLVQNYNATVGAWVNKHWRNGPARTHGGRRQ